MQLKLTKDQAEILRFYLVDCICSARSIGAEQYAEQLEQIYNNLAELLDMQPADNEIFMEQIPW
jgi:hypothetical protein